MYKYKISAGITFATSWEKNVTKSLKRVLCKQSQEIVKEFEMKATLGKFDIGNSMLVYFSLPK